MVIFWTVGIWLPSTGPKPVGSVWPFADRLRSLHIHHYVSASSDWSHIDRLLQNRGRWSAHFQFTKFTVTANDSSFKDQDSFLTPGTHHFQHDITKQYTQHLTSSCQSARLCRCDWPAQHHWQWIEWTHIRTGHLPFSLTLDAKPYHCHKMPIVGMFRHFNRKRP